LPSDAQKEGETASMRQVIASGGVSVFRIWQAPEQVVPSLTADVCLEWRGRLGHPSSYVLLGGDKTGTTTHRRVRATSTGRWHASLAGRAEAIEFGLPADYEAAVIDATGPGIEVTVAAHGPVSSSPQSFAWVAAMLTTLLVNGIPDDDAEFLAAWEAVRSQRRSTTQTRQAWVDAANAVQAGIRIVRCPQNQDANLDITLLGGTEWWLRCPACGAETFVRRGPNARPPERP
jgi:hypothetical protein